MTYDLTLTFKSGAVHVEHNIKLREIEEWININLGTIWKIEITEWGQGSK